MDFHSAMKLTNDWPLLCLNIDETNKNMKDPETKGFEALKQRVQLYSNKGKSGATVCTGFNLLRERRNSIYKCCNFKESRKKKTKRIIACGDS